MKSTKKSPPLQVTATNLHWSFLLLFLLCFKRVVCGLQVYIHKSSGLQYKLTLKLVGISCNKRCVKMSFFASEFLLLLSVTAENFKTDFEKIFK